MESKIVGRCKHHSEARHVSRVSNSSMKEKWKRISSVLQTYIFTESHAI